MTQKQKRDMANELRNLDEAEQYKWLVLSENKKVFNVILDNDSTYVNFGNGIVVKLKADCGDRYGTILLLRANGIRSELC